MLDYLILERHAKQGLKREFVWKCKEMRQHDHVHVMLQALSII